MGGAFWLVGLRRFLAGLGSGFNGLCDNAPVMFSFFACKEFVKGTALWNSALGPHNERAQANLAQQDLCSWNPVVERTPPAHLGSKSPASALK